MIDTKAGKVLVKGEAIAQKTFGMWDLFWGAEPFVKTIMLLLVGASVFSWALLFSKVKVLWPLRKSLHLFNENLPLSVLISELKKGNSPFSNLIKTVEQSKEKGVGLEVLLNRALQREMKPLEQHIDFLATLSSSAPFVGLLGTVWGIMNSFQSIAVSQNTSLDVVAPGIAEALAATALGLVVAIPAGIMYNRLSVYITQVGAVMNILADQLSAKKG